MVTSLLVGAGFSIPFGMPSTKELTEFILNSNPVETSWAQYLSENDEHSNHINASDIHNLLKIIYDKEKQDFPNLNYEDLFEISFNLAYSHRNPTNKSYHDSVVNFIKVKGLQEKLEDSIFKDKNIFNDLLKYDEQPWFKVQKLIQNLIVEKLYVNHLNIEVPLLQELLDKSLLSNIFSLNHDLIMEDILIKSGTSFYDGFEDRDGFSEFIGNFISSDKIKLLKLHGSINWYLVAGSGRSFYVKSDNNTLINSMRYMESKRSNQELLINKAAFLTGSNNKYEEYLMGLYSKLQLGFKILLSKTKHLIVTGYSFGDYGITAEIINWLHESKERFLTVIDPSVDKIFHNGFLMPRLNKTLPTQIAKVQKGISDISKEEVKELFKL